MNAIEPKAGSKGAKRRAEIMLIARTQLIETGFEGFSLRAIAAEVGIKLGNLQYYFRTKEDLIEALVRAEFADNQLSIQHTALSAASNEMGLKTVVKQTLRQWTSEGARVYAAMTFLALHNTRFQKLNAEVYEDFYAALNLLLAGLAPDDSASARRNKAKLIAALMDGSLFQLMGNTEEQPGPGAAPFLDLVADTACLIASR